MLSSWILKTWVSVLDSLDHTSNGIFTQANADPCAVSMRACRRLAATVMRGRSSKAGIGFGNCLNSLVWIALLVDWECARVKLSTRAPEHLGNKLHSFAVVTTRSTQIMHADSATLCARRNKKSWKPLHPSVTQIWLTVATETPPWLAILS